MKRAKDNGQALEKAVRLIQETLLKNDPSLKGSGFTVEWNKRITRDGVRHEVDLYVVAHPDTTYQSVVLFECKDWQKSVTTKEVMGLKEEQGWEDVPVVSVLEGLLLPQPARNLKLVTQPATPEQFARLGNDRAPVVRPPHNGDD